MSVNRGVFVYLNEAELSASLERARKNAARLTTQMDQIADKANPEFQRLEAQLQKTNTKIGDMSKQLDGKLGPSLKQIQGLVQKAWNELANIPVGTPEWNKKMAEFKNLNTEFIKIKEQVGGVGKAFESFASKVKTVAFGVLIGNTVEAALSSFQTYISGMVQGAAKISDELADIQKTTGLTTAEVKELNKELQKIDTRTSVSDLRQIAAVGGQFGVAQSDLADFVKAVDKINVALGDEFGGGAENVAAQLSKLRNIFTDIKSDSIDKDLLNIGNAINALGNDGAATADVVADFANRIAGVGVPLGLTTGQVLGISATLQELGVTAERGGTAVSKILQKMTINVADFAKIAGVSTREFSDLLNNDLFKAFELVVQGSSKAGEGATIMAKLLKDAELQGSGASEVFLKLSQNTAMMAQKVDLAGKSLKSTDSILQEFNSKNNNTAAQIEKLQKVFAGYFTGLNSLVEGTVATLSRWLLVEEDEIAMLEQTRQGLDLNLRALQDVNLSSEARVMLIEETNAKYGEYLPSLLNEQTSLEEINRLQTESNKLLMTKILTMSYEKELTKLLQEQASAYQQVAQAQINQAKLNTPTFTATGNTASEADFLRKQAKLTEDIYSQMPGKIDKQIADLREKFKRLAELAGLAFEDLFGSKVGATPGKKNIIGSILPDGDIQKQAKAKGEKYADVLLEAIKDGLDAKQAVYGTMLSGINTQFDIAGLLLKGQLAQNLIDEEEYAGRIEALEISRASAKLAAAKSQDEINKQAAKDVGDFQIAYDNKVYDAKIRNNKALEASNKELQKSTKTAAQETYEDMQKIVAVVQIATDVLQAIMGSVFDSIAEKDAQNLAEFRENQSERADLLDRQFEARIITEDEYNREKLKIEIETKKKEAEAAVKERKMKQDAFLRDKAFRISSAIMNTALAISAAMTAIPFNPLNAILAGATGLAQVGIIAAQKMPSFGKGGTLPGNTYHSDSTGGLYVYDPRSKQVVATVESDEEVTNRRSSKKYRSLLKAVNADDPQAISNWFKSQPQFTMAKYQEATGRSRTTTGDVFFDSEGISSAVQQNTRDRAYATRYMVNGIVTGIANVQFSKSRKL